MSRLAGSKLVPVTVSVEPCAAIAGLNDVMVGAAEPTEKGREVPIVCPAVVTVIAPDVALTGTVARRRVGLAEVRVAVSTPLNLTVLSPIAAPKPWPQISTCVPTGPESGVN